MPFFHPAIREVYKNDSITQYFGKEQYSGWYIIKCKSYDDKGRLHKTFEFDDIENYFSEDMFYDWVFKTACSPHLPFADIKHILEEYGIPQKAIDKFERDNTQVLYASKKSENNVIVYWDAEVDSFVVEDIIDFIDKNS